MKKSLNILIIGLIITNLITYTGSVFAVTKQDLQNEKNNISSSISQAQDELQDIKEEKSETLTKVEELANQISEYQGKIEELKTKTQQLENKISDIESQIKEDEEDLQAKQKSLDERLVTLYENGDISYLDVFCSSKMNIVDIISSFYLVSEMAGYDTEMMKQVEEAKNKLENEKTDLEQSKKELSDEKAEQQAKSAQVKVLKKEKEEKVSQLSSDEKEKTAEIQELQEHEDKVNAQITKLQKEYEEKLRKQKEEEEKKKNSAKNNNSSNSGNSTNKNNTTNSGNSSNGNNSSSSYGFGWPVSNPIIGTGYGVSGSMWSSGKHTGVDFRASTGTQVFSVGDGIVVDTGFSRAYGNFVEIYHGNNIYSFYAHASSVRISQGQTVSKGQLIMLSGATGNVSGPHLHFEIRTPGMRYANCVNPVPYLP